MYWKISNQGQINTKHQLVCKYAPGYVKLNKYFFYFKGIKEEAYQLFAEYWNPESTADIFAPNCKVVYKGGSVAYGARCK